VIDNIKFRKLSNGYTVRYHVPVKDEMASKGPSGFVDEFYVADKAALKAEVARLIDGWLERDPEPVPKEEK
jgi:hypothetical protein